MSLRRRRAAFLSPTALTAAALLLSLLGCVALELASSTSPAAELRTAARTAISAAALHAQARVRPSSSYRVDALAPLGSGVSFAAPPSPAHALQVSAPAATNRQRLIELTILRI